MCMGFTQNAPILPERTVWSVTGIAGRAADLPCYLDPRTPGDKPKLILWYKEAVRSPLFSHDTRAPQFDGDLGQGEGVLSVSRGAATLTYHNITSKHAGIYECRVDFYKSPAHSKFVNLTVIELPRSVQILDGQTGAAKNGVLGPYYTGQDIEITCISLDGWPLPNLTWWKNNHIIGNGRDVTGPGQVQSDLVVEKVTRDWHNQTLTCTASNTPLVSPVTVSVVIQLYLLPRSVEIRGTGAVREGSQTMLVCIAEGSRPSPRITWTIRGRTHHAHKDEEEGLVTVSTLLVNVSRDDDNGLVTCTAENPEVQGSAIANTTFLTVHYPPSVSVSLGRSINPQLLKEGADVYFTCTVDANPPASAITWYHEGTVQVQNMTSGVILSGDSLVLQKVSRMRAGQYKCSASNPLATVISAPVHLRIRYKPECLTSPTTYFIYDKPINVTCTVTSHPPVKAVHWQWNSSSDVIKTQQVTEPTERVSTQLTVFPIETYEDRLLSCWAVNEMGRQPLACGFSIKVAEMPLPLSSCRLANITASSLSLTCQRPDTVTTGTTLYRAEVYFDNRTLFANVTSTRPNFNVSRLDAGTSYQIKVYVTHGPVTSQPVVVSAYTSRTSRTNTEKKQDGDEDQPSEKPAGGGGNAGGPGTGVVAVPDGDGRGTGTAVGSSGGGGSTGGTVGGAGGMGAVMGVAAVSLVALVAMVWAWHYCRNSCCAGKRKDVRLASADDTNNPDVVPNIGSSFSGKRSCSPQRFWHKEKTFDEAGGGAGASGGAAASEQASNTVVDVGGGVQSTSGGQKSTGGAEGQSSTGCSGELKSPGVVSGPSPTGSQQSTGCMSASSSTGSQRTTGCVGSSSPSGSQRTSGCIGSSSPSGSQRTSGCVGSSSPSGSQRTSVCVGSSSPSGSQRTSVCAGTSSPSGSQRTTGCAGDESPSTGSQKTTGYVGGQSLVKVKSSGSPTSIAGMRSSLGSKVTPEGVVQGSTGSLRSRGSPLSHRPTAAVVFRNTHGGDVGARQRPFSAVGDIVVNPLRQSFLPTDDDYPEAWSDDQLRSPRDRPSYPDMGSKLSPREEEKYPGVRFSLPPSEELSYPGGRSFHGASREEGHYPGMRPKYKLREAESFPDIRVHYSPREERIYTGARPEFSPREERSYPGVLSEYTPRFERSYSGILPHQSPREERRQSPRDDHQYYPGTTRMGSQHSPRDDPSYPGMRPHRYSYIGVRVQQNPRDQLRHSYPAIQSYPSNRGMGTYPGVRLARGASRGSRGTIRTDSQVPVDQLIKATETVV
ncbi:uncharacterized protein LOC121876399 [Homarus americanus]|uniref:uncharacterized protein LOC121876399 n=1 Tax=Homarus americanus TaxID=6706 RepID=UPI001C457069|nr:uncharacterized protein LOC121876399 [Homarus americanus]